MPEAARLRRRRAKSARISSPYSLRNDAGYRRRSTLYRFTVYSNTHGRFANCPYSARSAVIGSTRKRAQRRREAAGDGHQHRQARRRSTSVAASAGFTPASSASMLRPRHRRGRRRAPRRRPPAHRAPSTIDRMSPRLRAERHAHADLLRALRHGERQQAVDADRGEHERDRRERRRAPAPAPTRDAVSRSTMSVERLHFGDRQPADRRAG